MKKRTYVKYTDIEKLQQGYDADGNPKEEKQELAIMPLICLRCKKDIPLTVPTFWEISYTHYSYCEECLRAGLRALRYQEAKTKRQGSGRKRR